MKLAAWAISLAAAVAATAATAMAAPSDWPANSIGVFFDTAAASTSATVRAGDTVTAYVITIRPANDLYAFELGVEVDPRLIVTSRAKAPATDDILDGDDNWAVSYRGVCLTATANHVLLTYEMFAPAAATDMTICLTGSTPSSFDPPTPGHLMCPPNYPIAFSPAYAGCGIITAAAAATSTIGFGPLKARYSSAP